MISNIISRVKVVVNAGTDQSEGTGSVTVPVNSASGFFSLGSFSQYRQTKGNKLLEAYANFNNGEKNSKHLVDVTLGYSYQDWYTASPNYATYSLGNPDSVIQVASANPFYTKNALLSFYGRLIYTFSDKYVFNAVLRRDGSSRFSPDTRWGLFPSVSAKEAAKSPKKAGRRKSFCARMSGVPGPMKDEKGRPTRKALALRKWDC